MPWDIGGLLLCQITLSALSTSLARAMMMLMLYLASSGLRPWKLAHRQFMLSVKGYRPPHGKIQTLCHGAQVVDAFGKDNAPFDMTPLEWCQAQAKDPAINQIVGEKQIGTLGKLKTKMEMLSDLKALIRIKNN